MVTCAVLLEGGIRLDNWRRSKHPAEPTPQIALLEVNPAGTGSYRLRAGLNLETKVENTRVRIVTNSHGMHWRETPLAPEPGRARVAFLGDSFTFGSWAQDAAHSFVGVFESYVASEKFEALNFGVGGYGLLDQELLLHEKVLNFKPAYVIVVVYTGNDFRDTWLGLDRERIVDGAAWLNDETLKARVPAEDLVEDRSLPLDCPPRSWRLVAGWSAAFERAAPLLDVEDLCVQFRPNRNFFMPGFWSRRPVPKVAKQAAGAVTDALSRMDLLLSEKGVRLAVVALPTADQLHALEPSGPGFDTSLPQSAVQVFCRDRRIPYLDLLPIMRAFAVGSNRRMYLKSDIHLNEFGHARVGRWIADWFLSRVRRP